MYQYNDNELLYLIYEENEEALGILFKKYENLIKKRIADFHIKQNDYDDFFQEGLIALNTAIIIYNPFKKKTFNKFFDLILQRRFMTILKNERHYFYNVSSFTYEGLLKEDGESDESIEDMNNMFLQANENHKNAILEENESFTDWELTIYRLRYGEGFPCKEVAKITNTSIKSVYNALFQIKKKLKALVDKSKNSN